jgi:hypothetical protein
LRDLDPVGGQLDDRSEAAFCHIARRDRSTGASTHDVSRPRLTGSASHGSLLLGRSTWLQG